LRTVIIDVCRRERFWSRMLHDDSQRVEELSQNEMKRDNDLDYFRDNCVKFPREKADWWKIRLYSRLSKEEAEREEKRRRLEKRTGFHHISEKWARGWVVKKG
jgi:hypothetical protein